MGFSQNFHGAEKNGREQRTIHITIHGAEFLRIFMEQRTLHSNTQNTKQATPMQTKTQNNTQYTISNSKEEQAPQEEEDSLTLKTGEEEAAIARKKPQHRRRRRGRKDWRTSRKHSSSYHNPSSIDQQRRKGWSFQYSRISLHGNCWLCCRYR